MANRVTSLSFSHYNPEDYVLDHESGLKLSSINKILLNLFNNDLYAYTILVGKMKGLWWKYWFSDATVRGYAAGDMVYANGVQEMQFLGKYWKSVQQIANYNVVSNGLPDFSAGVDDAVVRYLNALSDYFHLGNRGADGQIYISLKDDNKDSVPVVSSWQPYLVTEEELRRREYQLGDILVGAVREHNGKYHSGLDALDAADSEYETGASPNSIYDGVLAEYLPKVGVAGQESDEWVGFASLGDSMRILGFGAEAYDFLHVVKPLGTDVHRLETWVRTDGHVSVRGYVPTAMLTEIVPKSGTIEYNQWKMGGMRRYGMRLDYRMNDSVSKLYFKDGSQENAVSDEVSGIAARTAAISGKRIIDETDADPTEAVYRILSYNPPHSGTVVFHPAACDFPFEDLPNHGELLKYGDDAILSDLLNADAYTHTFEPVGKPESQSLGDAPEAECHVFTEKSRRDGPSDVPVPSPVDTADDSSNAASDVRLVRNFGTARSPALGTVLSQGVFPDSSEILGPSFAKPSSVFVGEWGWTNGQSVIFEVPSTAQNISFEIDGIMRADDMDFSLYDVCREDGGIRLVHDVVMNYEFSKSVISAAVSEGFEDATGVAMLVKNVDGTMERIMDRVLDNPTFIPFMHLRLLDLSALESLLSAIRSRADEYLPESGSLGSPEFRRSVGMLLNLYGYIYAYTAERMRYGGLHECFAEMMPKSVEADQSVVVLVDRLREFLKGRRLRRGEQETQDEIDAAAKEWNDEVDDAIRSAENETASLVENGRDEMAGLTSRAAARLKKMHERYMGWFELESKPLDDMPNLDRGSQEYADELNGYRERCLANFREIDAYLDEVEGTLLKAAETESLIRGYLDVEFLDEAARTYLDHQLSRLNDSMNRYRRMSLNVCLGYDKYIPKWLEMFGMDSRTELRTGYTVLDLLHGRMPMVESALNGGSGQ